MSENKQKSININIDEKEISKILSESLKSKIEYGLARYSDNIDKSMQEAFYKKYAGNNDNIFDRVLDWAIEDAFRDGLQKAMEELNFKEKIAVKAKEILQDDNFITKLAKAKVKESLGL